LDEWENKMIIKLRMIEKQIPISLIDMLKEGHAWMGFNSDKIMGDG
jgi:hypothetical protein